MDKLFAVRHVFEKYQANANYIFWAFIHLEKWKTLWTGVVHA